YSLQTELRNTRKGKVVGFTGRTTLAFGESERWRKVTAILARLSEFSNIGKGRTSGFGVVRARLYSKQ
ncbi:MAG: CRISPR system precrRNA processing endoribonuclease RAMP protein Cas6, partial [Candidatus Methanosuratincola petrocarbonis]